VFFLITDREGLPGTIQALTANDKKADNTTKDENKTTKQEESEIGPITECCLENQRSIPILGWRPTMLPTDPVPWSDETGKVKREKASVTITEDWKWTGDWEGGDWEYGKDLLFSDWRKEPKFLDTVRRRKWTRVRVRIRPLPQEQGKPNE